MGMTMSACWVRLLLIRQSKAAGDLRLPLVLFVDQIHFGKEKHMKRFQPRPHCERNESQP